MRTRTSRHALSGNLENLHRHVRTWVNTILVRPMSNQLRGRPDELREGGRGAELQLR